MSFVFVGLIQFDLVTQTYLNQIIFTSVCVVMYCFLPGDLLTEYSLHQTVCNVQPNMYDCADHLVFQTNKSVTDTAPIMDVFINA